MKKLVTKIAAIMMTLISACSVMMTTGCQFVAAPRELIDVQMMMPPDKTEYVIGESFDTTGLVLTAVYSDGTREMITNYTVDKTAPLVKEDTLITITYKDYKFEQAIKVIEAGDKIIMTLANGVDRCELYADGTVQLAGGGGSLRKPNIAHWSWDGENLEIWIPLVTPGEKWGEQYPDPFATKMDLEYDEQNNIQFAYMLAGKWQMHYFIQYREWSQVLTADVTYPLEAN